MNSPKFVSLLVVPYAAANPVRFVAGAETLRETETAALIAYGAESQLTPEGAEPPLWETYVRVRDVVGLFQFSPEEAPVGKASNG